MIPYMVGKLAPNSSHLTRGLVKYVPDRAKFVPFPAKTGTNLLHPRPPQSFIDRKIKTPGFRWRMSRLPSSYTRNTSMFIFFFFSLYRLLIPSIIMKIDATNSRSMIFVTIVSCVRWCVCSHLFCRQSTPFGLCLTYQPGFENKKTNTML